MRELATTGEVMEALGGIAATADLTATTYKAAANWKGFPTFPAKTYVVMTAALAALDCTAPPSLWGMTEPAEAAE